MNRVLFTFLFTSSLGALGTLACGGISDPSLSAAEKTASVSGALTGTLIPSNARVALVYRKAATAGATSVEVAGDAPVINGTFTLSLTKPLDEYFSKIDDRNGPIGSGSWSTSPGYPGDRPWPVPLPLPTAPIPDDSPRVADAPQPAPTADAGAPARIGPRSVAGSV